MEDNKVKLKAIVLGASLLSVLGVSSIVAHANMQEQGASVSSNEEIFKKFDEIKATAPKVDIQETLKESNAQEISGMTEYGANGEETSVYSLDGEKTWVQDNK